MDNIINIISVLGTFFVIFGLLFLLQYFTIGLIPFFKKRIIKNLSRGDLLFTVSSLLIFFSFFTIQTPY